ncbi:MULTISPECIES: nitroreductase family protein [unclassified Clostridium]|uniref:nitroreductase family protein n=1 Tax=unclassified Clostridium TaxID=2614128 RepID=UPI0002985DDC|nr:MULTISPECIES: nitroreductase family protein [unclassified Clostridium]EKQ57272.1 MAG: nitroreductase [Clostridium sp. Maddingley MBC34-26]
MNLINVNQSKCIKCGICSKVCPTGVLSIDEAGPNASNAKNCIACGQCVAVCPHGALDNIKTPLADQIDIENFPVIDSKTAENFLRSRRSIRCFKDAPVPREKLLEIINVAHYAPTASNSQGVSYIIVENKKILEKAIEIIYEWMESKLSLHWSFTRHVQTRKTTGMDTILRNAPHLIIATAPKDFKNGRENTISQLTYAELYATTIGLGSCWAGLFEFCAFSNYAPLLSLFNIPEDKIVTGAIMVGYPKYKYKKLVDRNPLDVIFIN